jgi:RNA polymerase sigma factor CnrH
MGSDTSPLRELTSALARGDDASWMEFHREFGPGLFRYLLGATQDDYALASEALQQAYLRVARHARPCDSRPMFEAWLRLVGRTALSDCRRRRQVWWKRFSVSADDDLSAPIVAAADNDQPSLDELDRAMTELDPADRRLLEAKYFAGESVRALAEQLGISEKALESRLTRARATLRDRLMNTQQRHA